MIDKKEMHSGDVSMQIASQLEDMRLHAGNQDKARNDDDDDNETDAVQRTLKDRLLEATTDDLAWLKQQIAKHIDEGVGEMLFEIGLEGK
ncbi:hypothetical protein DFQ28_011081 [Apophysomyces sp. BC1034]|nr:hypothetical protein DFQ29_009092 [Apophysomyces sp. BC1021]KAG0184475.1 hypothetical protein DFQ28_011081 [Apophysomyces sp. BC1034]